MFSGKSLVTLLALAAIVFIGTASMTPPKNTFKNLQVLPQDITKEQLDTVMHSYTKALKVSCKFCHTPQEDSIQAEPKNTGRPDFAADYPMKEFARKMMRMTIDINTNYFHYDTITPPVFLKVVTCNTCHRGNPSPINE